MPVSRLFIFSIYNCKDLVRTDLAMIQKGKEKQRLQNKVTHVSYFLGKIEGRKFVLHVYYKVIIQ